ncbi:hypothetical protein GGX14DRAFT_511699 [Mycena pura]|uniref:Uncharacterized protein n=1 Tax=Mycena pura TaxID=153505 RepID=A0AAD6YPF3_9AGAR|nr:hypothetical protein GGX14DRAFT_511699 [Mycena pura]
MSANDLAWDESDIFRGEPPLVPIQPRSPTPSHLSSASSSSGSYFGGRLGAIAAVVELAISRWAGNESSGSSSTSDSDHGSVAHSRVARTSRHSKSELHISTRIGLIQAREESRQIPRQFALYLPPSLAPPDANSERIIKTHNLPFILEQLDAALKGSTKVKRRERPQRPEDPPKLQHHHFMLPDVVKAPSRAASFTDLAALRDTQRKGKNKEGQAANTIERSSSMPKAWFLDIASPTWDDMRAIGKLLHLHPLTLEDILMKDPREKLEYFPKLGYYFLSFRAIESWDNHEKYWEQDGDQGSVAEDNVYLVVFKEGVCSFHFTDVSDHIDRIRNRILLLEATVNMSSDWIAHGILDSIVDSFFPFLQGLEKEVMAIENIVFPSVASDSSNARSIGTSNLKAKDVEKTSPLVWTAELNEKAVAPRTPLSSTCSSLIRRYRKSAMKHWRRSSPATAGATPTASTLHRMARARRLVTSLSRLLVSKSEASLNVFLHLCWLTIYVKVVAQLRKRLLTSVNGSGDGERVEVTIYLGDVQDHILTLENALAHYERMLSQSHPLYISQIRTSVAISKGGTDKALLYLTSVSIGVLCIQTLIGFFSMNVHVPQNALDGNRFNIFGTVLALAILILVSYLKLVLHWWRSAKRRKSAPL